MDFLDLLCIFAQPFFVNTVFFSPMRLSPLSFNRMRLNFAIIVVVLLVCSKVSNNFGYLPLCEKNYDRVCKSVILFR